MKVHERIRQHITENGILEKFVANRANIKPQRFYRLLSGRSPLMVDEFEIICRDGLNIDPGYFFSSKFLQNEDV